MAAAQYTIQIKNDLMVIITDDDMDDRPSITNSASEVIADLDIKCGGLGVRRVYYRDTIGRYDELRHSKGTFSGFVPCKPSQQEAFRELVHQRPKN